MTHYYTWRNRALLFLCFLISSFFVSGQVSFTANDGITPYKGRFRPGSNMGFLPIGWSNQTAADLLVGDPSRGIPGVGARAVRPSLASYVLEELGDEIELEPFEHYFSLGMNDLTAFVGEPSDALRDTSHYCPGQRSALFKNLYEPIWDNGENGTPVNDNNDFALYMYRIVTKYNNYVKFWEIWNEPGYSDSDKAWRPPGYPGNFWEYNPDPCDYKLHAPVFHYLRTLRIAYEVIKSVAPDDYVVVAGLGYPSFLDVLLRNTDNPVDGSVTPDFPYKGGAYFDVLGIHSYPSIDGTLRHWDDNIQGWAYMRNSDEAARQVIDERFAIYENVLSNHGYNGEQFPKKLRTITETNVPRVKFKYESLASDDGQRNFLMKAAINNKVHDVIQMLVYSIDDLEFEGDIVNEFQSMGFYKKFAGNPQNQVRHNSAIGYKTVADFIYQTDYDPVRTAALNLPYGVKGYAFKKQDGTYLYTLWAKTLIDNSEVASKTYSFPANFNINQVRRSNWNASLTGESTLIPSTNIHLSGSVAFFEEIPTGNIRPSVTLSTPQAIVNQPFIVKATFSESVTGMDASKFNITNGIASNFSGSGKNYSVLITPISSGPVVVRLPEGVANNNTNQSNTAAIPLNLIYKYCQPKGNVTYAWISSVRLKYLTKYSGKNVYNDFTEINFTIDRADATPVKLTAHQPANRNGFFRAWIDYNQDGQYAENEMAFQGQTNSTDGKLYTTFHIPTDALAGKTRMRVMFSLDDYPVSPCQDIENGEVEDYSVTITGEGGQNDCLLYVEQHEKFCDDMGTPIFGWDDQFSISMTVHSIHASGSWVANINGQTLVGDYNHPIDFGPYVIHNNEFTAHFQDATDKGCAVSTYIVPPPHCSNFEGVDTKNYCIPFSKNPWGEWVNNVTFGDINNTSFRKAYSDFSYHATDAELNQTYPVSLTTGFGYYTHPEYWRVWIDYNQNEIFEPSEIAFQQMVPAPPNGTFENTIHGNITIPEDATPGPTIMRVIMSRFGYAMPCDTIDYGEIEDYSVNIIGTPTPAIPDCSQLIVPANNATDVPLNTPFAWTTANQATGYKLTVGTTPNGHEIVDHLDVGNVTGYQFFPFAHNTKFYVKVTPYNDAGENDACKTSNFTTIDTSTVTPPADDCPTAVDGFTYLGEYQQHHYFVSQTTATWLEAKSLAESLGAQLVIINDASENEFIQNNISEIAFIGLSDYDLEGSFKWVDNSGISYSNFSDCSWCADNSPANDFYTIFPWDGSWSIDNEWADRKYIIEFNCGNNQNPCDLNVQITDVQCNDNGTADIASDDYFLFNIQITGTTQWDLSFNGSTISGTGASATLGPININNFEPNENLSVLVSDSSGCQITTSFNVPNTCSGGGQSGDVDLSLGLSANPVSPGQWAFATTYLTIENSGTSPAHNVKVQYFDQSNYDNWSMLGFNSYEAPSGTTYSDWFGIWDIPVLQPDESLTLEYTGFTKTAGPIPMFAQVTSCDEIDDDSSPDNNHTQIPVEDDEALVVLNPSTAGMTKNETQPFANQEITYRLFPNPAKDYIVIDLVNEQHLFLQIINSLGQKVYSQSLSDDHERYYKIRIGHLPEGNYILQINGQDGLRFMHIQ